MPPEAHAALRANSSQLFPTFAHMQRALPLFATSLMLLTFGACRGGGDGGAQARTYPYTKVVDSTQGLAFEVLDPAFEEVIEVPSAIAVLAGGFTWSEGPVWVEGANRLLFTDVPGNVMYRYRPRNGAVRKDEGVWGVDTFMFPSGYLANYFIEGEPGANGLTLDNDGALLMAQHGERQVVRFRQNLKAALSEKRITPDSTAFEVLAKAYRGRRLNSPNDLVQARDGKIYFTDPPYGVDKTFGEAARELDFSGVYRIDSSGGSPTLLYRQLERPNGIVLTPDESAFIVSNSFKERMLWMRCPVGKPSDTLELECSVFADFTDKVGDANPGSADGMVMLDSGVLLATGPGGVIVFGPEGKHLGTIRTGRPTANVTTGGRDGRDIFITADDLLLEVRLAE